MPDTQITTYPLDGITYDAADAAGYCATRTSGVYSSEADFAVTPAGGMRYHCQRRPGMGPPCTLGGVQHPDAHRHYPGDARGRWLPGPHRPGGPAL